MAQTLFTTQIPVSPDNADGTDSYTLGTYFVPAVDGTITHIRWYYPLSAQPGGSLPVRAALFRNQDQAKLAGDLDMPDPGVAGDWNEVALVPPVAVVGGSDYCVAIWTPRRYVASNGVDSPWPITNGDLSAPNNAGRFQLAGVLGPLGVVEFPTGSFNNAGYWVDVRFAPDGDVPAEGTVDTGLDLAVAATGARSSSGTAAVGLGLGVAASGSSPASGTVALTLGLGVAATGARASLGTADVGLGLSPAATGARASGGSAALGLNLAVSASGSNGNTGRPVTPFPFTPRTGSSYPWTPRPVKSFQEVDS